VEQVGIEGYIRVLSLFGYLRIEDRGSRLMRRSSILNPHSSILNHQSSGTSFIKCAKERSHRKAKGEKNHDLVEE